MSDMRKLFGGCQLGEAVELRRKISVSVKISDLVKQPKYLKSNI